MADELRIATGTTGLTVTAIPFLAGVEQPPIAMAEIATYGVYQGDMTGAAGMYDLVFRSAGATVGFGQIEWDGTAEIVPPTGAEIAAAVRSELAPEMARLDEDVSSRLAAAIYDSPDSAAVVAAAVLAAAQSAPIHSDTRRVNGGAVTGAGTELDPWGPL